MMITNAYDIERVGGESRVTCAYNVCCERQSQPYLLCRLSIVEISRFVCLSPR